jgi:antitoxin (DNA-binding transcriptional repressor) of toxin-antitoxin stability system
MKRITASEARRNWFRLLDEVLEGEVVTIARKGKRIVIRRDSARVARRKLPDYAAIIQVPDADLADSWTWDWAGPEENLTLRQGDDQ